MFPFEVIGQEIVQDRVAPVRVVPTLNPGEYGQACLGLGFPATPYNEFTLQSSKEALGHGVVIGVPNSPHGGTNTHLPAPVAKGDAGVLAALDALLFVKRQFEIAQFLLRADGSGQITREQCSV